MASQEEWNQARRRKNVSENCHKERALNRSTSTCSVFSLMWIVFFYCFPDLASAVPIELNHQGVVKVNGDLFDGTGEFRFALLDPDSGNNVWTNDGSGIGSASIPGSGIELQVSNGLYDIDLGDTSHSEYGTPRKRASFRMTTSPSGSGSMTAPNGLRQMEPDQSLSHSPYSAQAEEARHAETADHAVTATTSLNGIPPGYAIVSSTSTEPAGFVLVDLLRSGDFWQSKAPIPLAKTGAYVGTIHNRIYVAGGSIGNESKTSSHHEYDPVSNTWRPRAPMPFPRSLGVSAVVNGRLYAMGGSISEEELTNANEFYDPVTNEWTPMEPMPTRRYLMGAGLIAGKIYVAGGISATPQFARSDVVEVYDPELDSWGPLSPMSQPRANFAAAPLDGKLYCIAGRVTNDGSPPSRTDTVDIYDPVADSWDDTTLQFPLAVTNPSALAIFGRLFVCGGLMDNTVFSDKLFEYDPDLDEWIERTPMLSARRLQSMTEAIGRIFVMGGSAPDGGVLDTNEVYAPLRDLYVFEKD